jgi:hypothetical protein
MLQTQTAARPASLPASERLDSHGSLPAAADGQHGRAPSGNLITETRRCRPAAGAHDDDDNVTR